MFAAKIQDGFNMARMGRFDLEHSADDDRLIVYVKNDDGTTTRIYVNSDGSTSSESVTGSTYDDVDEAQIGV